jgi:hypothetical protein
MGLVIPHAVITQTHIKHLEALGLVYSERISRSQLHESKKDLYSGKWVWKLVFDIRKYKAGSRDLRMLFGLIISYLFRQIDLEAEANRQGFDISQVERYVINIWSHWNNAELSLFIPRLEDLKDVMEVQGDQLNFSSSEKKFKLGNNLGNLVVTNIHSSCFIKNYKAYLSDPDLSITFRDSRWLCGNGKTSLAQLGESLGIPKIEGYDFEKHDALYYFETDPIGFAKYNAIDAFIPLEAASRLAIATIELAKKLADEGYLNWESRTLQNFLRKPLTTIAKISETFIKEHMKMLPGNGRQNGYDLYIKSTEKREADLPPDLWDRRKGGLNKYFVSDRPETFENCDVYDIKSAYLYALANVEFPLWEPKHNAGWFNPDKPMSARQVAKQILGYHTTFVRCKVELPEGCSEHERPVLFSAGDCAGTFRTTGEVDQWLTMYEIFAIATMHPDAKIWVKQVVYWEKNPDGKVISLKNLMEAFLSQRKLYKDQGNEVMADITKLIANGGVGKMAQRTEAFDEPLLHDTIMRGGSVSRFAMAKELTSDISSPLHFNLITALVRCLVALVCWKSKAYMCVTDSVVVPHGAFVHNKDIKTPYPEFNELLAQFEWKQEYESVNVTIFKERDYMVYTVKTEEAKEELKQAFMSGEILPPEVVDEIEIHKVAKRGYKSPKGLSDREQNVDFFQNGIKRYRGGNPVKSTASKLNTSTNWLQGKGMLNEEIPPSPHQIGIGCHNLRCNCDSPEEFRRREKLKERFRRKGYADELHCQRDNPELHRQITKMPLEKPHIKPYLSWKHRRAVFVAHQLGMSYRALEKETGISKSTLSRWSREVEATGMPDEVTAWFAQQSINEVLKLIGVPLAA